MTLFCRLLPLWALLSSLAGYHFGAEIAPLEAAIIPLLTIIMFSMGLTLTFGEFVDAFREPLPLLIGVLLQFLLMPFLAWSISYFLALPATLFTGMVLLGTAPGGTASNVLTFLSGGRVALSVSMTTVSTLSAVIAMPWLSSLLLGTMVEVDRTGMLISILKMVTLPVLAGVLINRYWPRGVEPFKPYLSAIAVVAIALIVGVVVSLSADRLGSLSAAVVMAVLVHNILGLAAGYSFARLLRLDIATARTIAIEVGTQNSGLAATLALKHFSALAALPATLFSLSQNLFGSMLAAHWSRKPATDS
ncbi:MAG: bile acid:sodium symporter family protein [Endozoicomonas sp.]